MSETPLGIRCPICGGTFMGYHSCGGKRVVDLTDTFTVVDRDAERRELARLRLENQRLLSEVSRLQQENQAARVEALALFNAMDHGSAQPLDTVSGIISQISNMVAGLRSAPPSQPSAGNCPDCGEERAHSTICLNPDCTWPCRHVRDAAPPSGIPKEVMETALRVLAIDPGTVESGFVVYRNGQVLDSGTLPNTVLLDKLSDRHFSHLAGVLAIEMIASYGMPVGREVFECCVWIGRFVQEWHSPEFVLRVPRLKVKMHLCGSARAKDPNIWQALIDRFGPVGTKAEPGKLYGVKSHARAALALAVTVADGAA